MLTRLALWVENRWLLWRRALRGEAGQGMVEYGLILALVAVAVIVVLEAMGGQISAYFQYISDQLGTPPAP